MDQPLVTISIPIFKCEDFLEDCLESVRSQTYGNIEVTLINDKTPDRSVEIAEKFIEKYQLQNWKIYHLEENSGLSVVRNKGIDTANGKYIFFLDSDDQLFPETISLLVKSAEAENLQVVVGNTETINAETGNASEMFGLVATENSIKGNQKILESFVEGNFPSSSWNKLILVEFLKLNKLYFTRGLFAQDTLQSLQTALKLDSVGFIHNKTYRYFLHKNSVIHNRTKKNFDNWLTIAKKIDEIYKEELNPERQNLILKFLSDFKNSTLLMNWKAQKDKVLWKESYTNYKKLSGLSFQDYFNKNFSLATKKTEIFNNLPTDLGFKLFKWRYER
ncbi:glycosyltransferase [Halpernia frigidisoli]|uniref:Glycosyltransferase involved in cell wall bisynthesis n=1 Tax=Halpernia frigidisoli TaxID=1125876 RepID=A0A1I3GM08_9FLAO|nr:glycosyltransferase [Halpernia frigidisoli]SFI24450.1 Glycosyltransferase involved in cell wall bisynthesis [Halpernia frigidisoli]